MEREQDVTGATSVGMSMTPIIQHKNSERKNVDIMEKEPDVKEDRIAGIDMRILERRIF